ncbi:hypothetical protein DFP72DRAFT_841379 [Ephemerocybe angulata]|uniref:Uncharacterized protein n=1 Tax=Ephemerocybe angulata TaxID=980116 RepID=A0A8H6MEW5_9AGAR|nr:hypothetical protein DFP72DRAFT_841379 [Tulosesus angulatus]
MDGFRSRGTDTVKYPFCLESKTGRRASLVPPHALTPRASTSDSQTRSKLSAPETKSNNIGGGLGSETATRGRVSDPRVIDEPTYDAKRCQPQTRARSERNVLTRAYLAGLESKTSRRGTSKPSRCNAPPLVSDPRPPLDVPRPPPPVAGDGNASLRSTRPPSTKRSTSRDSRSEAEVVPEVVLEIPSVEEPASVESQVPTAESTESTPAAPSDDIHTPEPTSTDTPTFTVTEEDEYLNADRSNSEAGEETFLLADFQSSITADELKNKTKREERKRASVEVEDLGSDWSELDA